MTDGTDINTNKGERPKDPNAQATGLENRNRQPSRPLAALRWENGHFVPFGPPPRRVYTLQEEIDLFVAALVERGLPIPEVPDGWFPPDIVYPPTNLPVAPAAPEANELPAPVTAPTTDPSVAAAATPAATPGQELADAPADGPADSAATDP
ncbi:hypothetical protein KR018_002917 [Drosophila ironensis]|nr:hypothetical protein KR018_002917 [Drosophila ironensis]